MYAESLLASGVDWKELERRAEAMVPGIEQFDPAYVEEMRGIAEGAGEPFLQLPEAERPVDFHIGSTST